MKLPKALFLIAGVWPALAAAESLPAECRILQQHKPQAGVAYQPGVDVHGRPVVPADLNAPRILPDILVVPLSVDLAQRLQGLHIQGLELSAALGMLEIYPDGKIVYDGQDWTHGVHAACGLSAPPSAPDGQAPADVIKSEPVETPPPVAPQGELIEGGEYREEGYR